MALEVEALLLCTGISSMAFAVDAPSAYGRVVTMALVVDALMARAGAGLIAFQVDHFSEHSCVGSNFDWLSDVCVGDLERW